MPDSTDRLLFLFLKYDHMMSAFCKNSCCGKSADSRSDDQNILSDSAGFSSNSVSLPANGLITQDAGRLFVCSPTHPTPQPAQGAISS